MSLLHYKHFGFISDNRGMPAAAEDVKGVVCKAVRSARPLRGPVQEQPLEPKIDAGLLEVAADAGGVSNRRHRRLTRFIPAWRS